MHSLAYPNPAFLKLLTFRLFIVFAYQIMAIVVGWHIFELTHDTLALGLVGLAEVIPYFCGGNPLASGVGATAGSYLGNGFPP